MHESPSGSPIVTSSPPPASSARRLAGISDSSSGGGDPAKVTGLRVSQEVEYEGLDLGEHGERAYNP